MNRSTFIKPVVLAALTVLTASSRLWALGPEGRTAEVSVGGGYAHINPDPNDHTGDTGANHGRFDASVSYNLFKDFSFGGEYTFTSLASASVSDGPATLNANLHLHNYGGLLRFGLFNAHVAQPYLLIDGGGMNVRLNGNATDGSASASAHQDHYGAYAGAGIGVNAYLGHGFGVRPEFRYSRQQLNDTNANEGIFPGNGRNEISLTGQLFYTFGRHGR